jgi:hypothetical protein
MERCAGCDSVVEQIGQTCSYECYVGIHEMVGDEQATGPLLSREEWQRWQG